MTPAVQILAVVFVATFSGALAVPLGIFLGLHPLLVYAVTSVTAISVAWILLLGGEKLRARIAARHPKTEATESHTRRVIERYGPEGLGLIGPLFPGVVASAIFAVGLHIDPKRLGTWLMVGIATWFGVFTLLWSTIRGRLLG